MQFLPLTQFNTRNMSKQKYELGDCGRLVSDVSDERIYTKAMVAEMVRRSQSKAYKES